MFCTDWWSCSCFTSFGALVRVLYRLVIWFMFLIDWCFGSCLISIDTLVRVLYRLVLWFVFYFDWWCGQCFVWLELYIGVFVNECYIETMLTWPCREHKKILLKTEEPTSGRPWAEANRDMIHSRSGAPLPTHTHTVFCVKCTVVSGWQSVNRGGLHHVCTILRWFASNPRSSGMWHITVYSVAGVVNERGNLHVEGSADPRKSISNLGYEHMKAITWLHGVIFQKTGVFRPM